MEPPVFVPSNRFLVAQPDRRWPRVLSAALVVAGVVLVVLILVGWPRLRSTSVHYELIGLRDEVRILEEEEQRLAIELQRARSPERLARRAASVGLMPPPAGAVTAEAE